MGWRAAVGERDVSEYQSYEFRAVDRPLDGAARTRLRELSSRAEITPTSFSNEYHWGDFRGDPDELVRRYFDVFTYHANWGTRWCMFRLPLAVFDPTDVTPFLGGSVLEHKVVDGYVILDFRWQEEEPPNYDLLEENPIDSLMAIRQELAAGDLRPLYIGWLAGCDPWDEDDGTAGPPVPPGLSELTEAQATLAEFLYVGADLLAAAAEHSAAYQASQPTRADYAGWLAQVAPDQKDAWLLDAMGETAAHLGAVLRLRYAAETRDAQSVVAGPSAAALNARSRQITAERLAREQAAREAAERRRQEAERLAREQHLASLTGKDERLWAEVRRDTALTDPKLYDAAVAHLVDLQELARRDGRLSEFEIRVVELRERCRRKPSLLRRLDDAGL